VQGKLELLTGIEMNNMKLEVRTEQDELKEKVTDETLTLCQMGVHSGMKIHVIETNNSNVKLDSEDSPDVAFQLADEDYEKKEGKKSIKNRSGGKILGTLGNVICFFAQSR